MISQVTIDLVESVHQQRLTILFSKKNCEEYKAKIEEWAGKLENETKKLKKANEEFEVLLARLVKHSVTEENIPAQEQEVKEEEPLEIGRAA